VVSLFTENNPGNEQERDQKEDEDEQSTGASASRFSGLQDFFNIVLFLSSGILCFMLEFTMSTRSFEIFRPVVFLCT
jgi:hypothetical protein